MKMPAPGPRLPTRQKPSTLQPLPPMTTWRILDATEDEPKIHAGNGGHIRRTPRGGRERFVHVETGTRCHMCRRRLHDVGKRMAPPAECRKPIDMCKRCADLAKSWLLDEVITIACEIRTRICEVESADDFDRNDVAAGEYINGLHEALRLLGHDDEHRERTKARALKTIAKLLGSARPKNKNEGTKAAP